MQNKPNFQKSQMNVNLYNTMDYKIFIPLAGQKNKPNSNPNKPNLQKAKMNVNSIITKDYRRKDDFAVRINKPNFFKGPKLMQSMYLQRIMKNNADMGPKKTNPNKPNFKRPFFRKDIYWLPEHILSRNSPLVGYSLRSLNREYIASRVP